MILNDIIKLEVERIYYTNHTDDENKPKKWEDHDLFVPTKTNFSANFKKFCLALGIDSENFKNGNKTSEKEQQNQTSTKTTQQDNNTNEASNEKDKALEYTYNINSDEAQISSNEIEKTETNLDGIITTEKMTPTLQQSAENGKFQPSGGGANASENRAGQEQPKYTAEDTKNMTDDEFLATYKEGITDDEAAAVDSKTEDPGDYIVFLGG